jgi:hypothetical protein
MWPKRFRCLREYTADELARRDCEHDARKILKARKSGIIIYIRPLNSALLVGEVRPPAGGTINDWSYHCFVEDEGRYYDLMTGPPGMTEAEYALLFAEWDALEKRPSE